MKMFPESRSGKWSVGFTLICLAVLGAFFICMAIGIVDFDTGHWWDRTLLIAVPAELIALVLSIVTVRKEKSILVNVSLSLGIIAVIFLLTHSLYISD